MVKGLKDENAPDRPLSAYFAWQNSVREKVTKAMPEGSKIGDVAKKFSEMWSAMSDSQKAPFQTKYKSAMEKYRKKMEKYKTTKEYAKFQKAKEQHKLDSVKNSKFKRDENAPSRPQSAYFLFMADERDDLVADGMSHKEAMVELGKMWGKLSAAKKKPYEDKAATLKAKYTKQVEKYRKTGTYKKYLKEKDEFYANRKAELKKLEEKKNASRSRSKPKAPKSRSRSRKASRSKSAKKSARKASKPKAPKSRSRSKSARKASKPKKAKSRSRSRSRSKSKKRSASKAKSATKEPDKPKAAIN